MKKILLGAAVAACATIAHADPGGSSRVSDTFASLTPPGAATPQPRITIKSVPRDYALDSKWIDFDAPIGRMVQLEPVKLKAEPPPPPPAPSIKDRPDERPTRTQDRKQVMSATVRMPTVHVRSTREVVQLAPQPSTWHCRLPGMALNQLSNYMPQSTLGAPIVGATTSVFGTVFQAAICGEREAGHGEIYAAVIVGALPFPFPYAWAEKIAEWMLQGTNLCAPEIIATHYSAQDGIVSRALLQKYYHRKYCNGPPLTADEARLLAEVKRD